MTRTAELTSQLDAGTILPCMHFPLAENVEDYSNNSYQVKSVDDAVKRCGRGCLSDNIATDCIPSARSGTHALIHYCRPFLFSSDTYEGLVMGEDSLITLLDWIPTHRQFPLRLPVIQEASFLAAPETTQFMGLAPPGMLCPAVPEDSVALRSLFLAAGPR
ncbi:hypothetical protein HPB50_001693 [Hyalomma asiaticum]|uniref:Uncharacterized protein n=1 Tax=Hyalomma asiaticum TaxID=266040 RepID=A0ACB7T5A7_HYAAI|nr:hypothetical protein HPB50_001693 [Hyalomma asiaticum]